MSARRANIGARLAVLEERAARAAPGQDGPRVVVYLPRKDGDDRPLGVTQTGAVLWVRYDAGQPDPPLPDGW